MNVVSRIQPSADAAEVAHSVMAYDRATDELDWELPIPIFLDTLALKLAKAPPADKFGAMSYPLGSRAVDAFRFLLGGDMEASTRDFFLEPTSSRAPCFGREKLEALNLLTEVTPRARYARTEAPNISERELVLPTLRLLDEDDQKWIATSDLIARLTALLSPSGQDADRPEGRRDSRFSQKVRNMIAHRDRPSSFIHRGLARYEAQGLRLTDHGRSTVQSLLS